MGSLKERLEFIGVVAVVVSLLFVAYEIRQNTTSVQAAAIQASTEVARENIMTLVNDPSLIKLKNKGPGELTDDESRRLAKTFPDEARRPFVFQEIWGQSKPTPCSQFTLPLYFDPIFLHFMQHTKPRPV